MHFLFQQKLYWKKWFLLIIWHFNTNKDLNSIHCKKSFVKMIELDVHFPILTTLSWISLVDGIGGLESVNIVQSHKPQERTHSHTVILVRGFLLCCPRTIRSCNWAMDCSSERLDVIYLNPTSENPWKNHHNMYLCF